MRKKQAAIIALICGIGIFLLKLFAFFVSNSIALLSDALESIINILASGLMFFSISISDRDPDKSHEYGHQKIEEISCLLEGVLIVLAAVFIIITAFERLSIKDYLLELNFGVILSVVATVINLGISLILFRTAKRTGSIALEGDAKHLLSDVISTLIVWIGLFVVKLTGWIIIDPLLAVVGSVLILRLGIKLIIKSSNRLMDQSCIEEEKRIMEVLERHSFHFIDFHNLKTRRHGNQIFAEIHLSVNASLSIKEGHDLTDHLENDLTQELPNCYVIIHIEPPEES